MNPVEVNFQFKQYFEFRPAKVEKVIRLGEKEFEEFLQNPMDNQEFIQGNTGLMHMDEKGVCHCLLVTGEGRRDGVLVEAEGYGYARYASHVPDVAAFSYDSLSEMGYRLSCLVDQFVTKGAGASWEISFAEIREQSGLELGENEFLRELMADMIAERPEVASVGIYGECFRVQRCPELCHDCQKEKISENRRMGYGAFAEVLNAIRPESGKAAALWYEWAKEMEGYDKGGEPERAGRTAEEFLCEFARCFHAIQERHGDAVAGEVVSLAEIRSCIFPWEMKLAAEHLAAGGSVHDILPMSREGVLEEFSDGGQGETPVQSM